MSGSGIDSEIDSGIGGPGVLDHGQPLGERVGRRSPWPWRWIVAVVQAEALWRSRRRLAVLDDAALRDLGLTRDEAMAEAEKPVWNVPAYWLR